MSHVHISGCNQIFCEEGETMETDHFWRIIDGIAVRSGGSMDIKTILLTERLQSMEAAEILLFSQIFYFMMVRANTRNLWDASKIIHGYGSDDGFSDFRGNLISMGRSVFERAVIAPDTLADIAYIDAAIPQCELFQYVAATVYEQKTGEYPEVKYFTEKASSDELYDDEADLQVRYPQLWLRCVNDLMINTNHSYSANYSEVSFEVAFL